ncbi:hypothetical protein [Aneurinibacillus aneurinilyticus]|jgi:hypothetical protein|uniref:Immunity protein 30 domain-containing protein n=2 Tax=Aneurinibacillus aneurinilyticus TaxID=1391 RepID=A0A848D6G8_ANEAE|nr:hypothetical protein [Aneurinibacillus aneurinilyticus]ERI09032.1 hypothetical protein HMPREF0083_02889 [Aneurinibacillus aneurinilyticus ATCC 12856]MED0670159.1 hypothetical protein [Aneurinibacillus aneurinilyticus]MED0705450.1 hypothetical protein [Aneurinibacillus aneurinilyticus]MED0724931.1 hypothetical protein [Aneurinibacillus aneurinilyticus]MED0731047.1 hypothetical protein [Aneurinibacillus aneurinilyticus]
MNLEEFEKLPDVLPVETLALMFQDVLNDFVLKKIDKKNFLLILSQLMDRQVMTYELLESEVRNNVDMVLCRLWNTDSYEDVDIILSIVVNLGLKNCFQKIKESINQDKDIDELILKEILETIDDVGDNILNPYYDLEKFK